MAKKTKTRTLGRTVKNGKTALKSDFKRLKSVLGQASKHAKGNARKVFYDSYGDIMNKSTDVQDTVMSYTRKKPFKSLGFAVLAGVTIGFLLRK